MLLHHFTAREYLPSIIQNGLTKGEVPITQTLVMNAVWLTSDPDPKGHGLSDGGEPTQAERRLLGLSPTEPARFPNKRAVRLDVVIPTADGALVLWNDWAKKRLPPAWLKALNKAGGGKAPSWFLYRGVIPPSWIQQVHDLQFETAQSLSGNAEISQLCERDRAPVRA